MNRRVLVGSVALVGAALLGALAFLRGDSAPSAQAALRTEAARAVDLPPAEAPLTLSAAEMGSGEKREVSESVVDEAKPAADPLRTTLQQALAKFQSLSTYRFDMTLRVCEDDAPVLETRTHGTVRDHDTVLAQTDVNGERMEVFSQGGRARVRLEGDDEWAETDDSALETGPFELRSMMAADPASDPVLAAAPIEPALSERVDGRPCTGLRMNLAGGAALASAQGGATVITFLIDGDGLIRKWTIESEVLEGAKRIRTAVESRFTEFDVPWTDPPPVPAAGN